MYLGAGLCGINVLNHFAKEQLLLFLSVITSYRGIMSALKKLEKFTGAEDVER